MLKFLELTKSDFILLVIISMLLAGLGLLGFIQI